MVEQTIVHYAADGWLLHKSADEARRQMEMDKMEHEAATKFQSDVSCVVYEPTFYHNEVTSSLA